MGAILYAGLIPFIPSLAWLSFVLKSDIHPERMRDISLVFIIGILSAVPILFFAFLGEHIIEIFGVSFSPLLQSFFLGAVNEEIVKIALLYLFAMTSQFWDEPIDIFIYAATLALGFAGIENVAMAVQYLDTIGTEVTFEYTLILRSITAVLVHIISTFIFAYGLSLYKQSHNTWILGAGVLSSIGFHGAYNYSLQVDSTYDNAFLMFYTLVFIPTFFVMISQVRRLQALSRERSAL